MDRLIYYRKSFLLLIVGTFLFTCIWCAPHIFGWDKNYGFANQIIQMLLSLVLILILLFIFYLSQILQNKNKNIETARENNVNYEEHRYSSEIFYKNFKNLFGSLAKNKNYFVKRLPWYLLIGKSGVGKTNLLEKSGLNFLHKYPIVEEIKSNCAHVWQFFREAVIIEAPIAECENVEKNCGKENNSVSYSFPFENLFHALYKYSRRKFSGKTLNGIIVTLDLPTIIGQSELLNLSEQEKIKSITSCYRQYYENLVPGYLILTKCDQLAGFAEFFSDLAKEDREQLWGIVFPGTDFKNKEELLEYFNREFDQLVEKINQRLLMRLEQEKDIRKRYLISYFPQQLQLCKYVLTEYIQNENIILRGIYFISTNQEGKVKDYLMNFDNMEHTNSLNENYSRNPQKNWFVKRIFSDVILSDIGYCQGKYVNLRHTKFKNSLTHFLFLMPLILAIFALSTSYYFNKVNLEKLNNYIPIYHQTTSRLLTGNKNLSDVLAIMDVFRKIQNTYIFNQSNLYVYFELITPNYIQHRLKSLWHNVLEKLILTNAFKNIESLLTNDRLSSEIIYQGLKGYLAFGDTLNMHSLWIKEPFLYMLSESLGANPDELTRINVYLDELLTRPVSPRFLDPDIISKAREKLRKVNPEQFAYYEIKQKMEKSADKFVPGLILGPEFSEIFNTSEQNTIPALFTFHGYQLLAEELDQKVVSDISDSYQIVDIIPDLNDEYLKNRITSKFWELYAKDYSQYWNNLVFSIRPVDFDNLNQAIDYLELLTKENNPLYKTLLAIKENTFTLKNNDIDIASDFLSLNRVSMENDLDPEKNYSSIKKNLSNLKNYLATLQSNPNAKKIEFLDAKAILEGKLNKNPIMVLAEQAKKLPPPLSEWLQSISHSSMGLLLQGAHQVVMEAWQDSVIPVYNSTIKGRYPFANDSSSLVTLDNFGKFFGNQGVLPKFYQSYLSSFIDSSHDRLEQFHFGRYALGLNSSTLRQLYSANTILNKYFPNNDNSPLIKFSIKPRYLNSESSGLHLQLANQSLIYRHGPTQSVNFRWPFDRDIQQFSFSFNDFQGQSFAKSFDGPWGWFQLLQFTDLKKLDESGHYLWIINQNQHKANFDLWTENNLDLFDFNLFNSFSLPEQI